MDVAEISWTQVYIRRRRLSSSAAEVQWFTAEPCSTTLLQRAVQLPLQCLWCWCWCWATMLRITSTDAAPLVILINSYWRLVALRNFWSPFPSHMSPECGTDLRFHCSSQPDISLHCKVTDKRRGMPWLLPSFRSYACCLSRKRGYWKCRSGKYGSRSQGWKMQEWKLRHQIARVENAGVENARADRNGGKCRSKPYG